MKGDIKMSKKEINRIPIMERAIKKQLTNSQGAEIIGVSKRHFRRLKNQYKMYGVESLLHKSRGRTSNRALSEGIKDFALKIITEEYPDFGPTLALEKLTEKHDISMSVETLRKEMIKNGLWKSKSRRRANIHQLRERRSQEGELVQVDGSPHAWFEDRADTCDLLVFIDDATGKLLWLEFAKAESTIAYFKATLSYLRLHGRPLAFYSDKHCVFRVNTTNNDSSSTQDSKEDTQFGRAMRELDIEMIFANTPQAKGRVERVNQTLQDRLVKELRLHKISSIDIANKYLPKYVMEFNSKFSVTPRSSINAHRPLLKEHNLEEILCLKNIRTLSKNLTAQYLNVTYQIKVDPGYEYTLRRAKITIIKKLSGEVLIKYKNKELNYTIIKKTKSTKVYDSKMVNRKVDAIKSKQGHSFQFNLLGRTFLLWTKADISTLG